MLLQSRPTSSCLRPSRGQGSLEVPQTWHSFGCHCHPRGPVPTLSPCSTRRTDTLPSSSQGPPPHGRFRQSPCLTLPSGSPGRSPSTQMGASPSTLWSCSRWGALASPSGSTLTVAPRPPRSLEASTPAPATSFVSGPTPMFRGSGASP